MKHNYILTAISIVFMLFFAGCASIKVLDVPLISMTRSASDAPVTLKSIGEIKVETCVGTFENGGLIDAVVKHEQKKYKVDYIKDATLSISGSNYRCMEIVGEGVRIK